MTRTLRQKPSDIIKRELAKAKREKWEKMFEQQLRAEKLNFYREFRVAQDRRWRFDFHISNSPILIEIQGGTWSQGRHVRGKGYEHDIEKLATAQLLGYRVFWGTPKHVKTGQLLRWVKEALNS